MADRGFIAVFSADYFPDAQIVLEWAREDGGGNATIVDEKGMKLLCPAFVQVFRASTGEVRTIQVKAAGSEVESHSQGE